VPPVGVGHLEGGYRRMDMAQKKILIVDDSPTIRKLVKFTLEFKDFNVTAAEDGWDALEKIKNEDFDLFVVDIIMPKMRGIELIKHIRKNPKHGKTPIVVLSTEGREEDQAKGLKAGANEYLIKPIKPPDLIESMERNLGKAG